MLSSALIGCSGFVGSNLARQFAFDHQYRSTNIGDIQGKTFDLVVCAGIQAKKWWANQNPDADWAGIQGLLEQLETVQAGRCVLISTVDVYESPAGVDENSPVNPAVNHAYGRHRYKAEEFVRSRFPNHLVLRLPGLFGDGIKKNVIHDLLNAHELEKINPAGVYQYYFLDNLRSDIERAESLGLRTLNLSTEPTSTRDIAERFFPGAALGPETEFKATYDMHSLHWAAWNSRSPGYLYDRAAVLGQLETFIRRSKDLSAN